MLKPLVQKILKKESDIYCATAVVNAINHLWFILMKQGSRQRRIGHMDGQAKGKEFMAYVPRTYAHAQV